MRKRRDTAEHSGTTCPAFGYSKEDLNCSRYRRLVCASSESDSSCPPFCAVPLSLKLGNPDTHCKGAGTAHSERTAECPRTLTQLNLPACTGTSILESTKNSRHHRACHAEGCVSGSGSCPCLAPVLGTTANPLHKLEQRSMDFSSCAFARHAGS